MKAKLIDIEFDIESEADLDLLLKAAGETEKDLNVRKSILDVTESAPRRMRSDGRKCPRRFTSEEDDIVRRYPVIQASQMLKRNLHSIYDRRYRLGFERKKQKHRHTEEGFGKKYTAMTQKELDIIRQFPAEAKRLLPHRSPSAIWKARKRHGWL